MALAPRRPPGQRSGVEVDRNAEGPDVDREPALLGLGGDLGEGLTNLGLLRLSDAVDEELGLPDGHHAIDLADEDVESPVAGVGVDALHAARSQPHQLGDESLEGFARSVFAAGADELMEADHERGLTDRRCRTRDGNRCIALTARRYRCWRAAAARDRPRLRRTRCLDRGALPLCGGVEMSVDRGSGDAEDVGDLLNSALAGVVELLGERNLLGVEFRSPAAFAATSTCRGESVARVGDDELALQLGEDREHSEHSAAFSGARVDALLDDVQADAALAQLGAEGHEMQDRAAEAVQSSRVIFSVSPSRSRRSTLSSSGRLALAPLAWSM